MQYHYKYIFNLIDGSNIKFYIHKKITDKAKNTKEFSLCHKLWFYIIPLCLKPNVVRTTYRLEVFQTINSNRSKYLSFKGKFRFLLNTQFLCKRKWVTNKLWFSNSYIFETQCCRPSIFKTKIIVRSNDQSLNQRSTYIQVTHGYRD